MTAEIAIKAQKTFSRVESSNPVDFIENHWGFWNETWSEFILAPENTKESAKEACTNYAKEL